MQEILLEKVKNKKKVSNFAGFYPEKLECLQKYAKELNKNTTNLLTSE
ncbi:hypothetical protein JNG37_00480 [Streptococcus suis]|nr:hypothetical protein [Streptococcus suis]MBM7268918.1 hypothetical protein [Streptococcus suis]MBM7269368.1 hypothetical protein [Streptococcus suis]